MFTDINCTFCGETVYKQPSFATCVEVVLVNASARTVHYDMLTRAGTGKVLEAS